MQDQIADPDSPVIADHGLVLSIFDEEMQAKTLAAILKDPQTYTVSYLKKRAGQRQLDLGKAKFDTSDCDACSFNTFRQLAFNICEEEDESDAKCSKSSCYTKKTNAWLKDIRMVELEERFGNVILWETKPESDRRTIDAKQVGVNQYKTGCMNCEKRCTVVDDHPFKWGDYETDQCIDTDC